MGYVIARTGYTGNEYLGQDGWTRHKTEAIFYYGRDTADKAIAICQESFAYRVWLQH